MQSFTEFKVACEEMIKGSHGQHTVNSLEKFFKYRDANACSRAKTYPKMLLENDNARSILPSWYPATDDLNGSFFREQAIAIAKQNIQIGVISLVCAQCATGNLSLLVPIKCRLV